MSSSSVVHLDSDDDVTIVDPPSNARHTELNNRYGRTASMPPLPASAVSSSPVVPSAPSDLDSADTLTDSSEHRFPSYTSLREWMDAYAKERGYQVRWKSTGGEAAAHHGGTIRCWCWEQPPVVIKEEVISSTPARRTVHIKTSLHGGLSCSTHIPRAVSLG